MKKALCIFLLITILIASNTCFASAASKYKWFDYNFETNRGICLTLRVKYDFYNERVVQVQRVYVKNGVREESIDWGSDWLVYSFVKGHTEYYVKCNLSEGQWQDGIYTESSNNITFDTNRYFIPANWQ